ncbi:MAG: DUF2442 domain-containing protein [Bacteroidota bacterium]
MVHRITRATVHGPGILHVCFESGEERLFDIRPYLQSDFFRQLEDPHYFAQVRVVDGTVTWPNGHDFDPGTIYVRGTAPVDETASC